MYLILYSMFILTAVSGTSRREVEKGCWPHNVIPYIIQKGFSEEQKQWIRQQIREVHRQTCVRWVDISENNLNVTDYALFVKTDNRECFMEGFRSETGFTAEVTLSDICFEWGSGVIHEMMHVMGFHHEHQRSDRDCYIDIDHEKVKEDGREAQYQIFPQEEWLERFPYDKLSVMHYLRDNRMRARSERWYEYEPLGNTKGKLSVIDVWKIRFRFCNEPHYCDLQPRVCEIFDWMEKDCRKN